MDTRLFSCVHPWHVLDVGRHETYSLGYYPKGQAMSETRLEKHTITIAKIDEMGFPYSVEETGYLADDVERVLLKQCRLIKLLVDTGHKWDGYTLDYAEAQRLLADLKGRP